METPIQIAWTAPKAPDFELKEFALSVLEIAKENLQRDLELVAAAFIITADEIQCASVIFTDHDEKPAAYRELIKAARTANATALITCNDAHWKDQADEDYLESYYPGKLAADGAKECIMLTVSGPGIKTWVVEMPYEKADSVVRFGQMQEESGNDLGFLEGWASEEPSIQ